jgi:hypothetical protein
MKCFQANKGEGIPIRFSLDLVLQITRIWRVAVLETSTGLTSQVSAAKAGTVKSRKANASRSLQQICLNGPLGMKRGRGMRPEYSTTEARMQEAQSGLTHSVLKLTDRSWNSPESTHKHKESRWHQALPVWTTANFC